MLVEEKKLEEINKFKYLKVMIGVWMVDFGEALNNRLKEERKLWMA